LKAYGEAVDQAKKGPNENPDGKDVPGGENILGVVDPNNAANINKEEEEEENTEKTEE